MKHLRVALSLLTRVPVGAALWGRPELARAVGWFAVVGGLLGAALAGAYAGLRLVLPAPVASAMAVALGVVLTGALHEDGLADTADALAGRDREEALRILKDPAHGTYGVLALVLSVVLRVGALAGLDAWAALAVLPAAHALSRAAAAVLLRALGPARLEGLGASYAAAVAPRQLALGGAAAVLLAGLSMGPWGLPAAAAAGLGALGVGALARRRFGGMTGDVLGAAQQVGEVAVLALGVA
ncbi:MAG TPA: adenosylcobinamide-GDP ribazoletransferase, partial [Actinomycetota bacterium]|nr:adenosylcobinamide-GDP ribazoletransferase [Actinomycetota bacterium]